MDFDVLVAGGGPVGLCVAMDLAQRGIRVAVLEQRKAGQLPSVKCNHVASRTMESFRRLGFVQQVRAAGLPDDYPNDVVFRTRATGHELTRIPIPNRLERYTRRDGPDCQWATPEPAHRINQIYLEPLLNEQAGRTAGVTLHYESQLLDFSQDETGIVALVRDLTSGATVSLRARFLLGCDGGRSLVRKRMGAALVGDEIIQRVQSTYFRAPDLLRRISGERAWMSYLYSPGRQGNLVAIDGRETWLLHNYLLPHEEGFESVDRDRCLRHLLGVGDDFHYELLTKEDWIGRRLVADRLRDRRVFLCGDAAHLWVPYAGYGMNAGIADGLTLSWQLAAHLQGWGGEPMLGAYERERHPITEQVSRFAMHHAHGAIRERTTLPAELEDTTAQGQAARERVGAAAYALNVQQFACAGLNYGYFYDNSPLVVPDGEPAPAYTMQHYTPSTVPGCRLPHFFLGDGRSVYDVLGPWYSLLVLDRSADAAPLISAAAAAGMPLTVVDLADQTLPSSYGHRLMVVRPDAMVAWRGQCMPAACGGLVGALAGR